MPLERLTPDMRDTLVRNRIPHRRYVFVDLELGQAFHHGVDQEGMMTAIDHLRSTMGLAPSRNQLRQSLRHAAQTAKVGTTRSSGTTQTA